MITNVAAFRSLYADVATARQANPKANANRIAYTVGASTTDIRAILKDKAQREFVTRNGDCMHSLVSFISAMPSVAEKYGLHQDTTAIAALTPSRQELVGRRPAFDDVVEALKHIPA